MFRLQIVATAAVATLGVAAAHAETALPPTTTVAYGDLNLSAPQDARTLVHRVRVAAAEVCRKTAWNAGTDIASIERFDRCYRQAVFEAVSALGQPEVARAAGFRASPNGTLAAREP